jgi:hypothetical protein
MKGATRVGLALYRFLVRALLPGAFRQEYGEELVQAVAVRLAAAHGGLASWTALAAEVADLVRTAVREWRETAAGRVAERRNEHGTRESVMEDAWAELKVTLRALARRPGLALGVTLTIGLGVGATTAIYGVVDGVVLRTRIRAGWSRSAPWGMPPRPTPPPTFKRSPTSIRWSTSATASALARSRSSRRWSRTG